MSAITFADLAIGIIPVTIQILAAAACCLMLEYSRSFQEAAGRLQWTCLAAIAGASGIWAMHFVGILAYRPHSAMALGPDVVLSSFAILAGALTAGFLIAASGRRVLAGACVACGIVVMHSFTIMGFNRLADWQAHLPHLVMSAAVTAVPAAAALSCIFDRRGTASTLLGCLLFGATGLLAHHTGLAPAGTMHPARIVHADMLALVIGLIGVTVVIMTLVTLLASRRKGITIQAREQQFSLLVQGISDYAIYMLDLSGHVVSWNHGAERLTGYTADEVLGRPFGMFYSPETKAAGLPAANLRRARMQGCITEEGWRSRKDGSLFWAHVTLETVRDANNVLTGFAKITHDMTAFKASRDELDRSARNLNMALSNMRQGLCMFDDDERMVMYNDRVSHMFGVSPTECPIGTPFPQVLRAGIMRLRGAPIDDAELADIVGEHRAFVAAGGGTMVSTMSNGMTVAIHHRPMEEGGWVTTFDDVTEQHRADARIAHMAMHDDLTGLPNRANFLSRLDQAFDGAGNGGCRFAILGIDLDRFKEVNDLHGHATGDIVLREMARRIRTECGADDTVARFGGDEFAVLIPFSSADMLGQVVGRIEMSLREPVDQAGFALVLGASIGVATYPEHGTDRDVLINNADLAMYRAKQLSGDRVCFYSKEMDEASRSRRQLAKDLRDACARGELSLVYQPQHDLRSEQLTGFEALLRWRHPQAGWIPPVDFIPVAEEDGSIVAIGEWVLNEACREAARWRGTWRIAVNISPIQLARSDLFLVVSQALVSSGLPANRLELEITETALITDKLRALHVLRQIKGLGVHIALDDFGTGYSSLDTLSSFPFDKIKIDRSFLWNAGKSPQARAIIRAVIALGRSMAIPVLAEGLETVDQRHFLLEEKCAEVQGYYYGKPVPMIENMTVYALESAA